MPPPSYQIVKARIKRKVVSSIIAFVNRSRVRESRYQPLDLIMPVERKIRSLVGGLETALGTTLWEPLAKELASLNGFEIVTEKLKMPRIMPGLLSSTLDQIIEQRLNETTMFNSISSHSRIRETCQEFVRNPIPEFVNPPSGLGVDIWLLKNNTNYFFDTKTVQPNIGDFAKYLRQILTWYGYFYCRYPSQNLECRIVFPYNPYNGDFFESTKKNARPLTPNHEVWVENQFWDFCSGIPNTFQLIEECFNEIREEGTLSESLRNLFNPSEPEQTSLI
jgi:hypothetical protein